MSAVSWFSTENICRLRGVNSMFKYIIMTIMTTVYGVASAAIYAAAEQAVDAARLKAGW